MNTNKLRICRIGYDNSQLSYVDYAETFQLLHHVVKFDEKWENGPTLVISYNIIRDTKHFVTR